MAGKRVLLYYLGNKRSVAIETLCKAVIGAGETLILLTLSEKGPLHEFLEPLGIPTYSYQVPRKPSWKYFLNHIRFLRHFCALHQIETVWSHLQGPNTIAVLAQPFLKASVVAFRHHAESDFYAEYGEKFGMQRSKNEIRLDRTINRFAKKIVVPSKEVWVAMEKFENCDMRKVSLIPYIYDFSTYPHPDAQKVNDLRNEYSCGLLLIMVGRMIVSKQHQPVFRVVKRLISEGLSIKMFVMDDGELRPELENFVAVNKLDNDILFFGFRQDLVNYMKAADLLVHPSLTEASNNVVKEMGILEKTVAVCRGVGDFDDYITEDRNGFFLDRNNLEASIEKIIKKAFDHPEALVQMGKELGKSILQKFSDTPSNRSKFLQLI